jgi:arylsulfatase A-like enzyme
VLLCTSLLSGCGRDRGAAPNVLLITIDTLRADRLSGYGYPYETSPSIDALAARGVVFRRAIAASSKTVPSHASIMTSRYVRQHSVGHANGDSILVTESTLAEHFQSAGYATAGFVGNILLTRSVGLDRGFDHYDDELTTPERNRPMVVERLAEQTTRRALDWLMHLEAEPFFLWVHYQDPHGPYTPPLPYESRFSIEPPRKGDTTLEVGRNSARGVIPSYQQLDGLRSLAEYEGRYAGEIAYADRWIGKLVAAVDEHSSGREAVIVLTSDHGESFGEEGHYFTHTHGTAPDVAHVPLILRASSLQREERTELVSHVDIFPTVLELAGLELPEGHGGVALGPVLRGEESLPDRFVYCDNGPQVSAYRGNRFLRLRHLERAWRGEGESFLRRTPPWQSYSWSPGRRWSKLAASQPLPEAVLGYAARTVEMKMRELPSEKERELLRALGYLD